MELIGQKKHTDVILNGSFKRRLTNNLNLCFPGIDAESIISKLKTIACSTASACSGTTFKTIPRNSGIRS